MKNYFFFRSTLERNAQRELRHVLHALPGQMSYRMHQGYVPVSTTMKVQTDSASRTMVINAPLGAIFGVAIEGNTHRRASLKIYTRDGEEFYRVDNIVPFSSFDQDMAEAYRRAYPGGDETRTEENAAATANDVEVRPRTLPLNVIDKNRRMLARFRRKLMNDQTESYDDICQMLSLLLERMACGTTTFTYVKVNGELRHAKGTRNRDIIDQYLGEEARGNGARLEQGTDDNDGILDYFDIDRRDWRRFCIENIQTITN